MSTRPPSHVVFDGPADAFEEHADAAAPDGWQHHRGWDVEEQRWDLTGRSIACIGRVDAATLPAAITVAARGAVVIAHVDLSPGLLAAFLDDLWRTRRVDLRSWEHLSPVERLPDLDRRLLRALGDGASVREAAGHLYLSQRTAERRLGAVRKVLGVATTAEAVLLAGAPDREVGGDL